MAMRRQLLQRKTGQPRWCALLMQRAGCLLFKHVTIKLGQAVTRNDVYTYSEHVPAVRHPDFSRRALRLEACKHCAASTQFTVASLAPTQPEVILPGTVL